jgi:hypothetical protein
LALHQDLLEQAIHLARREPKKPKQASLRRAVSAAYYALFHLLISSGARHLAPAKPAGLKLVIQRAFNHGQMRDVCAAFVEGNARPAGNRIPPATKALLSFPLAPALVQVLQAFVDLQEARHDADYNPSKIWNRLDVLNYVYIVQQAFADWKTIEKTPNASTFMAALLLQKHWGR